jgi:hypothetical protein
MGDSIAPVLRDYRACSANASLTRSASEEHAHVRREVAHAFERQSHQVGEPDVECEALAHQAGDLVLMLEHV